MKRSMGITLRTALLSWLVTIATLAIFVMVIIPQQKRMFLENLESKANGVAVSLRDVVAGSAVNEDYSSVVDHCKEVLNGDQALDYLVITKNDGFSLINDRTGWRLDTNAAKVWRPDKREPASGIGVVPVFNRRVFHYSQPFDYSGIQWGWLHVGLSLESYDRSVANVYQRTGVLAIGCILLSLLASTVYAKRLVRPILNLQGIVTRVAGGDLSARAEISRRDELGSLANSVNLMTEALLRRDKTLQSVRYAAQAFLSAANWREVVVEVLTKLGEATAVSRIRVFENHLEGKDAPQADFRHEWVAAGIDSKSDSYHAPTLTLNGADFALWTQALHQGKIISANVSELDEAPRRKLEPYGIKAVIVIPITVEHAWWGILTLVDCHKERRWTESERDSIRAVADMLGATIARQRAQDALVEAKETLEQRVGERTKELREQAAAKVKAHAALADAQQRLIEASRRAGMAEVATGVLHNVGNVLNSVNVSSTLISDRIHKSRIANFVKAAQFLQEHRADLGAYLTDDPKGRLLPSYLTELAPHLAKEQAELLQETEMLAKNIGHIKDIVAMQQSYAKVSGVTESLSLATIVEDALQMNTAALQRHAIEVIRDYQAVPLVTVDKHKVLQILLNLIRNAKYAMDERNGAGTKCLQVSLGLNGDGRVKIAVKDNGIGIKAENMTRIFSHGFTTRKNGHGFGLHTGALAAKEMGGTLTAHSDGPDQGALFVLELPLSAERPLA